MELLLWWLVIRSIGHGRWAASLCARGISLEGKVVDRGDQSQMTRTRATYSSERYSYMVGKETSRPVQARTDAGLPLG